MTAATARHQEQCPAPVPVTGQAGTLIGSRRCYVCKAAYRDVHPDYHLLCGTCAADNLAHRDARCELEGRTALVTGGHLYDPARKVPTS